MMSAFVAPDLGAPALAPGARSRRAQHRPGRRVATVTAIVTAAHVAGLWALSRAWSQPASPTAPRIVQVQLLTPEPAPPQPAAQPAPPPEPPRPKAVPKTAPVRADTPPPPTAPPQPEATPTPAPEAVAVTSAPPVAAPATPAPGAAVAASAVEAASPAASAAAAPAAAPRIELPSASAAYLNNPPPPYPALSRRLGEQGRVVLRVRIEPDGTASAAEIRTSSGYERLDQAALQAVLRWRYVPGKRNGVPEAMWFLVPVQFVLQ
ncbi:outer membrane transport energization protein TonB [Tepidimonas ignava]|uniref:Outer membrane transport energization protein TonB n=3 Tax=Tepidimonas ignava TaxID=114249 RepID=A0A4R3LLR7_9BURK|nr:outer membrane transport energization protein TonB [Tepidimonas ignava]TSE22024.1 hypothetical protein Tigna_01478 [Tepidimonas ignava]